MPIRLTVHAGPSESTLKEVPVNSSEWIDISSDDFEGRIAVQIKGFVDSDGEKRESKYFERPDRKGKTWSIAFQGRFRRTMSADDVLFGNTFDHPLSLPWGTSAVLSFMSIVDPTLQHDLQGPKPWALSPLITTMPFLRHTTLPVTEPLPDPQHPPSLLAVGENTVEFEGFDGARTPQGRKSYFQNAAKRKDLTLGPEDVLEGDFCHSYLQFPELYLALPGGLRFDLKRYWDGRPVRFVCCERAKGQNNGLGQVGKIFWMVELTVIEADAEELAEDNDAVEDEDEDGDEDEDDDDDDDDDEFFDDEGVDEEEQAPGFPPARNDDVD